MNKFEKEYNKQFAKVELLKQKLGDAEYSAYLAKQYRDNVFEELRKETIKLIELGEEFL